MPALRPTLTALESRELPAAPFQFLPTFPFADSAAYDHVRAIATEARLAGRNPSAFLKIGDSNSEGFAEDAYLKPLVSINPAVLAGFGPNIINTWATFRGSFGTVTGAAYPGYTTLDVLANLPSAIAATNPGAALIMIGTNDAYRGSSPAEFRYRYELIVSQLLDANVVPILSTIPEDLAFGDGVTNLARAYNQVIAEVAESYRVPLWNFSSQLAALPTLGLGGDRLHLNTSPNGGGAFGPGDLAYGQNSHNLGALTVLDWYRQAITVQPTVQAMPAWTSLAGHTVYAIGLDLGQAPVVSIYDATTNAELNRFYAFEPTFLGGVRVATGDVDGDSIPDIVCGAGPTGGPVVAVFSGADGSRLATFFAYEGSFRGGVGSVAVRDLDGDGKAEIAVGAGNGGGPAIAVYQGGTFEEAARFFAYDSSFRGGVNVALGRFEEIGSTIVAGAGVGGGPHVKVFAWGSFDSIRSYLVDDSTFRGGITVAAGDFDRDGWDELATGRAGSGYSVAISDPISQAILRRLPPRLVNPRTGVRLGVVPDGAGDDLLVANGPGTSLQLDRYTDVNADPAAILTPNPARSYGIYVG